MVRPPSHKQFSTLNDQKGVGMGVAHPPQPQLNARKLWGTHIKQKKSAQQKLWSQVKIKGELNELCSYIFFFCLRSSWPNWKIDAADSTRRSSETGKEHH